MAIVHINIEDKDGEIAANFVFKPGGFDTKSNAHQLANLVKKILDDNLKLVPGSEVVDQDEPSRIISLN